MESNVRTLKDNAMPSWVRRHEDLDVYKQSFATAMRIFNLSKSFPHEERYSLTDQLRRSGRSVSANIAEAWRKRRYEAYFTSKLGDSESEAAETQTWIRFAHSCGYLNKEISDELYSEYDHIIARLIKMITNPKAWKII